jgi:hypothetical protein
MCQAPNCQPTPIMPDTFVAGNCQASFDTYPSVKLKEKNSFFKG